MRKILTILVVAMLLSTQAFAVDDWTLLSPLGSSNASDIDTLQQANNTAVDRVISNYKNGCNIYYISAASVGVATGEVVCSNTAGSLRQFRKNTSALTLTWANIDAGAEASSTQYYVYAVADADSANFTALISTNASTPTGATYFKKIGSFYNNSSGNVEAGGKIIMWSGTTATIPTGYVLCDGNNGTPDLTDRFIVGAGNLTDPGDSGGRTIAGTGSALTMATGPRSAGSQVSGGDAYSSGSHTHDAMPHYYALAYIMRQGRT